MREILFRGAQKVDGCKSLYWYEGSLVSEKDGYTGEVEHYIQNESGSFLVIPETVGQFTGLTDKNGNKIFEGDICAIVGEEKEIIKDDIFVVSWGENCGFNLYTCFDYEIIGNIHDNPELLKEAEQE